LALHGGRQSTHSLDALLPRKEPLLPPEQEDRWTPELIWMPKRREKYLAPAENHIKILSSPCPS